MSSFVSRGAVLASARLLNQALVLLSPLLLVRLLDIVEYGRYRQFMADGHAGDVAGRLRAVRQSQLPDRPLARTRSSADITKTTRAHVPGRRVISALVIVVFRPWLVPAEIADSWWLLLAVYVFLFLNLEVLVAYWLAHGQSVEVMGYTLVVTVWRLATLLAAALYFRDVEMIFVTIVCAEALKNLGDLPVAARRRPAGVPLGARGDARADAPGGAARARLGAQQGQRVRQGGGGHADGARCRWLSTRPPPTRCRW